ncbi:MAG TPA: tryptophan--tRNA ligase [Rhodanobacteraceae bacterium]|nr:tryptophan--tRNA ligase [Rhodanobacteraceae bacterium]
MTTRVLTGITTTGTPHLGNYVGAIRPAIEASRRGGTDAFFFLADYHALVKCDEPARVARSRLEIAATWLACGLDPQRVTFYRQSNIPEIPELTWLLTCVAPKGLMNRAHAYKAAVDANTASGDDQDAGINLGLYSYPVLMAADILIFNANQVPVGRDQVQHIEMTRDIGQRFNHIFGAAWRSATGRDDDPFVLPEVVLEDRVATLPGLDGRKMSKSYDNTVPLFEGGAKAMREAIARIVTDSKAPGEPKDPDSSALYAIYRAFANENERAAYRDALLHGLSWGEAKQKLGALIDAELGEAREKYARLMAHPDEIEDILREGAAKARAIAMPFVQQLKETVGLGTLDPSPGLRPPSPRERGEGEASQENPLAPFAGRGQPSAQRLTGEGQNARNTNKRPRLASFRDVEGFRFRLFASDGEELLLSRAFDDPKALGECTRALLAVDAITAVETLDDTRYALVMQGDRIAVSSAYADANARDAAIAKLHAALDSLRG